MNYADGSFRPSTALADLYSRRPGLLADTEALRSQWEATCFELLDDLYGRAVYRLGKEAAENLFVSVVPKRGRGDRGQGKAYPDRDAALLAAYDKVALSEPERKSTRLWRLARQLAEQDPRTFGTAGAVEKRLRRLLRNRAASAAAATAQFEQWREEHRRLFGEYPRPSLLAAAAADNK